jgi:hypothetical protein
MKRIIASLALFLMILAIMPTHSVAQNIFLTGNNLVSAMREYDKEQANVANANGLQAAEYMAYVIGVFDATTSSYNLPAQATTGQVIAVVSKYLKDHPEDWSKSAADLVMKALREAFPKTSK